MEQTQSINPELPLFAVPAIKIDGIEFGNLVDLPKLYDSYRDKVATAKNYTSDCLFNVETVDMKTIAAETMELKLIPVKELRIGLVDRKKELNDKRMPHTRKMKEISDLFVALENDLASLVDRVAGIENKWELEKRARNEKAKKDADDILNKEIQRMNAALWVTQQSTFKFAELLIGDIDRLNRTFKEKAPGEITGFLTALQEWNPVFDGDMNIIVPDGMFTLLSADEKIILTEGILRTRIDEFNETYSMRMREAIAHIGDTSAVVESVTHEAKETNDRAESNAAGEEIKTIATAIPVNTSLTTKKGTSFKTVYAPTTHLHFTEIMKQWVSKEMNLLTVDELKSKLSFMVTAANKHLSAGVAIHGIPTIEEAITKRR